MESNLGYRPGVSQEVFACLEDEQVNVYCDICNQLVLPAVAKEKPEVIGMSIGTQMQLMARPDVLQDDQGELPAYPCGGGRQRDHQIAGRTAEA
ncbi:MAG: hypothetical protein U0361_04485 [Nitrospiraceae bacterium]